MLLIFNSLRTSYKVCDKTINESKDVIFVAAEIANQFTIGEFLVDRPLNTIARNDEAKTVEPRVMEVLCYLVSRPQQVVTRQELMDALWQSQVTDGAISRVVGLLRKALNDDAESPRYIQTIAKKGYRFIAIAEPVVDEPVESERHRGHTNKSRVAILGALVASISLVILMLLLNSEQKQISKLTINNPGFVQLTSRPGFEYDASLSFDENWLVFRHRKNSAEPYQLYLKQLASGETHQLTASNRQNRSPAFSRDNSKIAFFRKGENYCRLMLLDLNSAGQARNEKELYTCGAYNHYSNVTWSPDGDYLYFTDRASEQVPYQIFKLQLATRKVDEVTRRLDNFYGDNELAMSPSGQYLAFFRNKYWGNNQVYIIDLKTGEERKLVELGFLAWNISWTPDENYLLYSDNNIGGNINSINVMSGEISNLYSSPQPINAPELSISGDKIIYSTESASVDLWSAEIKGFRPNDVISEVSGESASSSPKLNALPFNSTRIDHQPVFSLDGSKVLFLSDRNGSMQLWLKSDNSLATLSDLNLKSQIDFFRWHPDGQSVVVATSDKKLYWVDTKNNQSREIDLSGRSAAFPHFSNDGKKLYFTSDASGDWQIWSLVLSDKSIEQVTNGGGYQVRPAFDNARLFYTKYRQDGIWAYDLATQSEKQIINKSKRWTRFEVCSNAIIYLDNQPRQTLWRYDLRTNQETDLMVFPRNSKLEYSLTDNCGRLILSQWKNIESDIVMLTL